MFFGDRGDRGDSDNRGRRGSSDGGGCGVFFPCGNYGNNGGKDSGGDSGGRGNSDNPRRDEGVDADWKTITTVVVVAMVADTACDGSEDCGIYGDSGGNISYGDGDARGGSDDAENCGNYGDSFYSDRGGRGGSDHPGFDEGGKVALEAMTAVVAVTKVADGSDGAKDFGNSDGSGCEASEVTAVVDGSDDPGRDEGSDDRMVPKTVAIMPKSAENFVTATAVVAAVVDNPRRDESDDVT
ncbi:hypothetical protein Bbelb_021130 [Branchiostoma belcheri]|nr:hypothetical protein Bbelb_021130 [Branchiostoma belcheri]